MKFFLLLFLSFLFISTKLFAYELINVEATGGESNGLIPFKIEKFNPLTGEKTILLTFNSPHNTSAGASFVDEYEGKVYIVGSNGYSIFDIKSNTIEHKTNLPSGQLIRPVPWGGVNVIEEKSDGSIHVGQNSAVFKEENGREKFWAQDANGKSIPIDITNGSRLLINGRDVEQSINNIGALSAALTGLPTVPSDTTLACGLGTGTHGGDFAFSGGCASKINDKLSINYATSMIMPGQNYAGDFKDQFSARAGFVWKLGKAVKLTQISIEEKEKMEAKIFLLEENNKKIISQNKLLLERLERLEKIALRDIKSKDLAFTKN
tara:strand:+ start:78 stop:1040 length:963 start_codon:yes stop_codon:yes gene_type:complete